MYDRLLPRQIDNAYGGYKAALWLFGLLVLIKAGIGLRCIFSGFTTATTGDGIPLDTFTTAGAQAVVSLFALWGLMQCVLCLLSVLALVRYRAMVPLLFALFLLEHLCRKAILHFLPIATTGTAPGFFVNLFLLAAMVVGLGLSLRGRDRGTG